MTFPNSLWRSCFFEKTRWYASSGNDNLITREPGLIFWKLITLEKLFFGTDSAQSSLNRGMIKANLFVTFWLLLYNWLILSFLIKRRCIVNCFFTNLFFQITEICYRWCLFSAISHFYIFNKIYSDLFLQKCAKIQLVSYLQLQ